MEGQGQGVVEVFRAKMGGLTDEVTILNKAGRKQWLDGDGSNQAKPKAFVGTRDAKALENHFWDMERLVGLRPRRRR